MNHYNKTILIVEDNPETYADMVAFFTATGLIVYQNDNKTPVDNYENALEMVTHFNPDIAIIDIELKNLGKEKKTGLDLCNTIRQKKLKTFIIILTGTGGMPGTAKAKEVFADDYVIKMSKDYDYKALWTKITYNVLLGDNVNKDECEVFTSYEEGDPERIMVKRQIELKKLGWVNGRNWSKTMSSNNNVELTTVKLSDKSEDRIFISRSSLKDIAKKLPFPDFIQINRSEIINNNLITARKGPRIIFIGGKEFTVGPKYLVKVMLNIKFK